VQATINPFIRKTKMYNGRNAYILRSWTKNQGPNRTEQLEEEEEEEEEAPSNWLNQNMLKEIKLYLQRVVEAYKVIRRRGSHIVKTIGPEMPVRLLALRAGRAFPIPTNISWYSFPAIQDRVH
jgi:hypothetical protein